MHTRGFDGAYIQRAYDTMGCLGVCVQRIQDAAHSSSASLVFASPPNLRLETGLDRVDGPPGPARLAGHEKYTVFFREERIRRLACLASDVFDCTGGELMDRNKETRVLEKHTDVSTEDMLDLLLLETTFDDEAAGTIDGPGSTHFGEHVLNDVLRLPVHTFADVGDVGKDGLLVTLTHDLGWRDSVTFAGRCEKSGIRCVELTEEPVEELQASGELMYMIIRHNKFKRRTSL